VGTCDISACSRLMSLVGICDVTVVKVFTAAST
jgi:hypothetical protein